MRQVYSPCQSCCKDLEGWGRQSNGHPHQCSNTLIHRGEDVWQSNSFLMKSFLLNEGNREGGWEGKRNRAEKMRKRKRKNSLPMDQTSDGSVALGLGTFLLGTSSPHSASTGKKQIFIFDASINSTEPSPVR